MHASVICLKFPPTKPAPSEYPRSNKGESILKKCFFPDLPISKREMWRLRRYDLPWPHPNLKFKDSVSYEPLNQLEGTISQEHLRSSALKAVPPSGERAAGHLCLGFLPVRFEVFKGNHCICHLKVTAILNC